jgi:RNA polymerase primary sigma factor
MQYNSDFSEYTKNVFSRYRRLSADEEIALSKRIQGGDLAAVAELVEPNLPLVISIAKHYYSEGMPLIDIIQEGNIGLVRAAKTYDYKRKTRFGTHAAYYVYGSIQRALEDKSRTVRIPSNFYYLNRKLKIKYDEAARKGKQCTERPYVKLDRDKPYHPDNYEFKFINLDCVAGLFSTSNKYIESYENYDELEYYMVCLSTEEREIIERYFGLYGKPHEPLKEIAKSFGKTYSTAETVLNRGLAKMFLLVHGTKPRQAIPKPDFPYIPRRQPRNSVAGAD